VTVILSGFGDKKGIHSLGWEEEGGRQQESGKGGREKGLGGGYGKYVYVGACVSVCVGVCMSV